MTPQIHLINVGTRSWCFRRAALLSLGWGRWLDLKRVLEEAGCGDAIWTKSVRRRVPLKLHFPYNEGLANEQADRATLGASFATFPS